ncbi:hypothetical protein ACMDCR_21650 [Labrys okinawensis]|uniref:hypothetical protein n=1 Tax=Labrys okinawensis TaxID=346911 RepID=UPI0039BCCF3F
MRYFGEKLFLIFVVSSMPISGATASVCSSQIAQLRQAMPHNSDVPAPVVASAPQSVSAQLDRQPTPASIERAKQIAQANVEAALMQAQTYDDQGKTQECESAVGKARLMLNP